MKMDLGQNILEKSLLIYPTCPEKDAQISPYAHSYLQNCIKTEKSLIIFIFIPLSST